MRVHDIYIRVYNTDERVYTDERVTGVHSCILTCFIFKKIVLQSLVLVCTHEHTGT